MLMAETTRRHQIHSDDKLNPKWEFIQFPNEY